MARHPSRTPLFRAIVLPRYTVISFRPEDPMHPDLVAGKRLPDLELPDHNNQPTRFSKLAGNFPLILAFYRGYW